MAELPLAGLVLLAIARVGKTSPSHQNITSSGAWCAGMAGVDRAQHNVLHFNARIVTANQVVGTASTLTDTPRRSRKRDATSHVKGNWAVSAPAR